MKHNEMFGKALWIKADETCVSPCFRGVFEVNNDEKTVITASGLGFFKLFINGKEVSDEELIPARSHYHHYDECYNYKNFGEEMESRIYCMQYDITSLVKKGKNTVCAVVAMGWYKDYNDSCVFCYKIENGEDTYYSDESVKWFDSPITEYNLHYGEKHDYTKHDYDGKWMEADFDDSQLRNVVKAELPETEYYIQDCPADKVIRTLEPKKIFETDGFDLYDLGENITGWFVFKCEKRGEKVEVFVSEELDENKELPEKWAHNQTAEFICDGTDREYRMLFTWHGFRYIKISKNAELIRVDVVHSDVEVTSDFKCENEVLNWFRNAYIRTQLSNMHACIPSDCPHIERLGYTGDGQLTCEAVMLQLDSHDFYRKWIRDIADCQDKNSGHVQYTAPYHYCGGGPGGWGSAIAEVPYTYYLMFGESEPMKEYFDQMIHYLDYLEAHSENDLVVSDQPGYWCLGDWCAPSIECNDWPAIPAPFVNNYFYIKTINRLVELADKIGREADVQRLEKIKERKVKAIMDNFFDDKTGDFAENKNSANVFALDIGLGDERTLKTVVCAIENKPIDTGIFGTDLMVKILFENGYADLAIKMLSNDEYPSYGFMMKSGATTLWEQWQYPRSMSHPMFGSATKYLFYNILGIRQKKGSYAFEEVIIEPNVNDVTGDVSGFFTTVKGKFSLSTDRKNGKFTVEIPEGVIAEYKGVKVPAGKSTLDM